MPRESGLGESWTRQVRARHRRPASSCVRSPYPSTTQHPSHYPSLVPRLSRPSGLLHASWPSWLPAPHAWARRPAALRSAPARPTARRSIHATLCTSLVARSTIFSRPSLASCISSPALPAPHAWARRPAALRSAPARPTQHVSRPSGLLHPSCGRCVHRLHRPPLAELGLGFTLTLTLILTLQERDPR